MEYYSATERNEVLTHAALWMNFKNMMLSETSPTQNVTYYDYVYMKCPE